MKSDVVQLALALLTLVIAGALEELFPKILGVGFPFLLASVVPMALRRSLLAAVIFAFAAGGMEDSLSNLPVVTSASYFAAVAVLGHLFVPPMGLSFLVFPFYQLWLLLWLGDLEGGLFMRFLFSFPVGWVTFLVVRPLLNWAERKAAVDAP